jgi:GntR family L-lactate dehydrogenase operon transcriptional regulator
MVEYELLNLLNGVENPMGAVTLSLLLKEKGLNVSSATVGRMLNRLDHEGISSRHGFQGRMLTNTGIKRLAELKSKRHLAEVSTRFYESVDAESKDNLIDVLVARRGIEREIAWLAAIRATEADFRNLRKVYGKQIRDASDGKVSADSDVLFHQALAKASKNKVLAAAYDFIWQNGRFSPVMEYIRSAVGRLMAVEHGKILDALVNRDPDEAQKCMVSHIDNLLTDVQKYWDLAYSGEENAAESGNALVDSACVK